LIGASPSSAEPASITCFARHRIQSTAEDPHLKSASLPDAGQVLRSFLRAKGRV
jgi:hypothetical protein